MLQTSWLNYVEVTIGYLRHIYTISIGKLELQVASSKIRDHFTL